jgi:hypothetical protein
MSTKRLSRRTGLPVDTIRLFKRSGLIDSGFKTDGKNSISGKTNPIISELEFLANNFKMLISDLKPDGQEAYVKVTKLTYLLMARFNIDEITKMFYAPVLIPETVKNHIRELGGDNNSYPILCGILRGLEFDQIHHVFELCDKIGTNLILPEDSQLFISDIQKKCSEITDLLGSIKSPLWLSNIMLILAIIFIVGTPIAFFSKITLVLVIIPASIGVAFAFARSRLLSLVEKKINAAKVLSETLTKMLANFELNVDFCKNKYNKYFEGNYLNYNSPTAAASDYMDEITSKSSVLAERAWSVNELLNKIKFDN